MKEKRLLAVYLIFVAFAIMIFLIAAGAVTFASIPDPPPPSISPVPDSKEPEKEGEKPVKIFLRLENQKFVGREKILITGHIVYLIGVKPDFDALKKINRLGPFDIENISKGEEIGILEHIVPVKVFAALRLDEDKGLGDYILPGFTLDYVDVVKNQGARVKAPDAVLSKVPAYVSVSVTDDVINIGDVVQYNIKARMDNEWFILSEFIEQINVAKQWGDLERVSPVSTKESPRGSYKELSLSVDLSYYGVGGRGLEIPSYEIPFSNKSGIMEMKEAPALHVRVNSLLWSLDGLDDISVKPVKKEIVVSEFFNKYGGYVFYGMMGKDVLFFLSLVAFYCGRLTNSSVQGQRKKIKNAQKRLKIYLEKKQEYVSLTLHGLRELNYEIRRYLAALAGLSGEESQSAIFPKLIKSREESVFPEGARLLEEMEKIFFSGEGLEKMESDHFFAKAKRLLLMK